MSTPPPEARPARRSSGPQWEEGKSYLSTPVPADPRAEPPTDASASPNTIVAHRLHSGWTLDPRIDAESRRSIADQLFPLAVERCFVLGITAVPDTRTEKSRVAAEIALALAEARHPRVLLLEGDFQWPTLHTLLNIEMPRAAGVSQQVRNHGSGHASQWSVVEVGRSLHVMAEGLMRSPGLMLSSMFEDSLRYFRRHYDFIVIDGPMASAEVDCRAFDSLIDGVAIVSSATSADWLTRAHMLFPDKRFSTVLSV